jgi:hypothetical protein
MGFGNFLCGCSGRSKRERAYYVDSEKLHQQCRNSNPKAIVLYQNNVDASKGEKEIAVKVFYIYIHTCFDKLELPISPLLSKYISQRPFVPDENVKWSVYWPEYNPVPYTSPKVLAKPVWADPDDVK